MSKCEKRCEDCIHCDLCLNIDRLTLFDKNQEAHCKAFKDKSLLVELPCRCAECEHLTVINNNKIYAKCEKTGLEFLPFEIDTREHYCSFAKLKEIEDE